MGATLYNLVEEKPTKALILANGDPPEDTLLHRLRDHSDLFLAADGAAHHLENLQARPDAIVGDLDSLDLLVVPRLGGPELIRVDDPECSDLEKCVRVALDRGAESITVTGSLGGRIDHALTHISLLIRYHNEVDIRLRESGSEVRAVSQETRFFGEPGDTLSLICFAPVHGVELEGVRWPLRKESLLPGSRPVSNEFASTEAVVRVEAGVVIATHLIKGHSL